MGMQEAVRSVFRNYATLSGRARRAEYWWFLLFAFVVGLGFNLLDGLLFGYRLTTVTGDGVAAFNWQTLGVLSGLWSLGTLIPSLAVSVRRLHDTGRSGWWMLLILIPFVGIIIVLVWMAQKSDRGANTFGPEPAEGMS